MSRNRISLALICSGWAVALALTTGALKARAAEEIAAPPNSDDFFYPGAKAAFVNLPFPKGEKKAWSCALVTADAPADVMKWYLDRVGLGESLKVTTNGLRKREEGKLKQTLTLIDIDQPRQKGEKKTRVFQAVVRESGGKRGDFVLSVSLHSRPGTDKTEILVSYIPGE